MKVAS